MVWSDGNVVSAKFITSQGDVWDVSIISDTKKNLERFDIPKDVLDFLHFFNRNNIVAIFLTKEETNGINVIPAGTKLFEYTYTYTFNNEVNSVQESVNYFTGQEITSSCTYNCQ
jgi:hypothetical protein